MSTDTQKYTGEMKTERMYKKKPKENNKVYDTKSKKFYKRCKQRVEADDTRVSLQSYKIRHYENK
jgi:hypothetical protein